MELEFGKRKVGRKSNGFWITIPKLWAKLNNVNAGDFVHMEMDDEGQLIIVGGKDAYDGFKSA